MWWHLRRSPKEVTDRHQEPPGTQNQGEADPPGGGRGGRHQVPSYSSTWGFQLELRGFLGRFSSGVSVRCYMGSSSV